jgi:hypothetical protein
MSQNGMVMPASRLLTFGRSGFAVLVGAIVIAGAALRCLRLDNGLWYDEGFSLHFARAESFGALLHELAKTTASERLQQLYTFLLHYWRGLFGESEHSLRALSVLLGTAAILLLADAARRLGGRQAALAAALLSLLDAWAADLVRPARGSRLAAVGAGVLLCLGSLRRVLLSLLLMFAIATATGALLGRIEDLNWLPRHAFYLAPLFVRSAPYRSRSIARAGRWRRSRRWCC